MSNEGHREPPTGVQVFGQPDIEIQKRIQSGDITEDLFMQPQTEILDTLEPDGLKRLGATKRMSDNTTEEITIEDDFSNEKSEETITLSKEELAGLLAQAKENSTTTNKVQNQVTKKKPQRNLELVFFSDGSVENTVIHLGDKEVTEKITRLTIIFDREKGTVSTNGAQDFELWG